MRAAFLRKPGDIIVDDIPIPEFGDDQVLINIKEVGLCGSDLHYYNEGRIGDHVIEEPHILGHESSGIIVAAGKNVHTLKPGDRVAVEPGVPCMQCDLCLQGKYNLCNEMKFLGAPPYHGTFREYLAQHHRFVYKLPENVSFTQGALVEPFSVAYNALAKACTKPGESILIIGAGAVGMACLELAKTSGLYPIIVAETDDYRAGVARLMGADEVLTAGGELLSNFVSEITSGKMCNYVLEASGCEEGISSAVMSVGKGGTVVIIGMGKEQTLLPRTIMLKKEAVIRGLYRYANYYPPVISLFNSGKIQGMEWITHKFPIEEIEKAMKVANDPKAEKVKLMICF